jgi:hypothetical protein
LRARTRRQSRRRWQLEDSPRTDRPPRRPSYAGHRLVEARRSQPRASDDGGGKGPTVMVGAVAPPFRLFALANFRRLAALSSPWSEASSAPALACPSALATPAMAPEDVLLLLAHGPLGRLLANVDDRVGPVAVQVPSSLGVERLVVSGSHTGRRSSSLGSKRAKEGPRTRETRPSSHRRRRRPTRPERESTMSARLRCRQGPGATGRPASEVRDRAA